MCIRYGTELSAISNLYCGCAGVLAENSGRLAGQRSSRPEPMSAGRQPRLFDMNTHNYTSFDIDRCTNKTGGLEETTTSVSAAASRPKHVVVRKRHAKHFQNIIVD